MSQLVYALVLLGCGDGGAQCTRIAAASPTYANRWDCEMRIDAMLKSDTAQRADFPEIEARCVAQSRGSAAASPRKGQTRSR